MHGLRALYHSDSVDHVSATAQPVIPGLNHLATHKEPSNPLVSLRPAFLGIYASEVEESYRPSPRDDSKCGHFYSIAATRLNG